MITNPELLEKFENDFVRQNDMSVQEKFDMMDQMFEYANQLGALSKEDTTGHLESLIKTLKNLRNASKDTY
ncbi:MAG: hypothetical protein SGI89_10460 [bacterium]|nr:hypothetical protein [bacterium]